MDDIDAEILKAQRELEALQGDVDIDEEIKRAELELESLKVLCFSSSFLKLSGRRRR
jgi:hypothetical protein